ncbi:hypothetical protein ACX3P0_15750 [Mesorhizobium sp. A556]
MTMLLREMIVSQIMHPTDSSGVTQGDTIENRLSPSSQFHVRICALVTVGIVTVSAALVAILSPDIRPLLLQEDGIIEMGSVVFLIAAVLGAAVLVGTLGLRIPLLLAGLIGFAELMDETSFGSRLFGFEPLPLYGGGQLDGFHDLLILAYRLLRGFNQDIAWLWLGLMLVVSMGLMTFALMKGIGGTATQLSGHALLFLHVGFIGLAQIIDAGTSARVLSAMEEVFELNAAILLTFYILQQALLISHQREARRKAA